MDSTSLRRPAGHESSIKATNGPLMMPSQMPCLRRSGAQSWHVTSSHIICHMGFPWLPQVRSQIEIFETVLKDVKGSEMQLSALGRP